MRYSLPKFNYARTTDYVGTTDDYTQDEDVNNVKESIRRNNKQVRETSRKYRRTVGTLLRLRIKPRGPRSSSVYHTTVAEATHFDLYVGEDTSAMYMLRRELETGLTPGELRKMDSLFYQAKEIEWKGLIRNRTLGYWDKESKALH